MNSSSPREPTPAPTPANVGGLIPSFGLFTVVMLVVGGVIGSGIFKKPGVMAAQLGSPELVLGVWVLAGVITLFGVLTNAEIAGMIPETGGQYVFYERMFGPFFAFLYGWAIFAVIQSGSISAIAYVFGDYATKFVALPEFSPEVARWSFHLPGIGDVAPLQEIGVKAVAAALIIGLILVNYLGVRFGGLVQNIFTLAKMAAMAGLVLAAFFLSDSGSFAHLTTDSANIHPRGFALLAAIAAALQGAFWAYDGWNKVPFIAGEIHEPQRNIPRALGLGMLLVTIIYVLVSLAYAYVLPVDEMARSRLVAADAAEKCFAGGGRWVAALVMVSTFGATNAVILATARVYYSMAQRGVLPAFLGRSHPRFRTPAASLGVQCVWSVLLLFSGTFDMLTDMLIFVTWVFYAVGAYGVFVLRKKEPNTPRPYKVPGYPWVPAIFVVFATVYILLTVYNDVTGYRTAIAQGQRGLINSAFGTALVLAGAPLYWVLRTRKSKSGSE